MKAHIPTARTNGCAMPRIIGATAHFGGHIRVCVVSDARPCSAAAAENRVLVSGQRLGAVLCIARMFAHAVQPQLRRQGAPDAGAAAARADAARDVPPLLGAAAPHQDRQHAAHAAAHALPGAAGRCLHTYSTPRVQLTLTLFGLNLWPRATYLHSILQMLLDPSCCV